ncbi:MAG: hypothetical protein AABZ60_11715 [Planctomycetota bacterium]
MKNVRGNILVLFLLFSMALFVGVVLFFLSAKPLHPRPPHLTAIPAGISVSSSSAVSAVSTAFVWPPQVNRTYPNLKLVDQTGTLLELNSLRGKVLLIEPIGMTCPACQAFCGAKKFGEFHNIPPQKDLPSIEEAILLYGDGALLSDVVYIQLLLFSLTMEAPTEEDAREWAEHFHRDRSKNQIVLAGNSDLLGSASYNMIPGFQLIDKKFVLRFDSTGHHPSQNLYQDLLPNISKLVTKEEKKDISVTEAYEKVPKGQHARSPFSAQISTLSTPEKLYLEQLFQLTDQALVQRVQTLSWFQSNGQEGENFDYYQQKINGVLEQLSQLIPPQNLKQAHDLLIQAIQEQCSFFKAWDEAVQKKQHFPYRVYQGDPVHLLVSQSSAKLINIYNILIRLYPSEDERNKQSFYAHLCYLDFI